MQFQITKPVLAWKETRRVPAQSLPKKKITHELKEVFLSKFSARYESFNKSVVFNEEVLQ